MADERPMHVARWLVYILIPGEHDCHDAKT